jgi:hypothetical protein
MEGEGVEPGTLMLQIYRAMCDTVHERLRWRSTWLGVLLASTCRGCWIRRWNR